MERTLVLIDADNVPARFSGRLAEALPEGARVVIVFNAANRQAGWQAFGERFAARFEQVRCEPQAADMALAIAAGEELAACAFTDLVLVSRDSDLAAIARYARSRGLRVTLAAHARGGAALRAACDAFLPIDEPVAAVRAAVLDTIRALDTPKVDLAEVGKALRARRIQPPTCGLKRWLASLRLPIRIRGTRLICL